MAEVAYIGELKIHPAALLFPEMDAAALDALYEGIKKHGVLKPIVLYRGELVDGRNRVRASMLAGIGWERLPQVRLPDDEDPYAFAWAMNCQRLDYDKEEKAMIHLRIEEESGRLATMRSEAAEAANRKRAESTRARHAKEKGSRPPHGGQLPPAVVSAPEPPATKADRRNNSVAAQMAKAAHVSQRTMQRVLAKTNKGDGGRPRRKATVKRGETWRVPREVHMLAADLRARMPSDEVRLLGKLLLEAYEEPTENVA